MILFSCVSDNLDFDFILTIDMNLFELSLFLYCRFIFLHVEIVFYNMLYMSHHDSWLLIKASTTTVSN